MSDLLAQIDEIIQTWFLIPQKRLTYNMPGTLPIPKETPEPLPWKQALNNSESESEYYYESIAEDE